MVIEQPAPCADDMADAPRIKVRIRRERGYDGDIEDAIGA
jgi:hypothetical protein